MIYRDGEDYTRAVTDFLHDFGRATGGYKIEEVNPDTKDGDSLARTYDIVEYPTLIALTNDGVMQEMWRGTRFPLISELTYYIQQ